MYQDKFVVAIKSGGKILRETKDLVKLPFGSEFSVLVKNLNSRRAKFILHIDGQDVLSGTEIIVNANSEIEMKRFIRNGNMNEGNAFKFIERTQTIEDGPRGIKVDDGVVRVEFWFEQEKPLEVVKTIYHETHYYRDRCGWNYPLLPYYGPNYYGPYYNAVATSGSVGDTGLRGMINSASGTTTLSNAAAPATAAATSYSTGDTKSIADVIADITANDAGITVPGAKVEQKFTQVYGFNSEAISNVIILRMAGMIGAVEVVAPVTVKSKQKCTTCGKLNKATSAFCSGCGTALELL